MGLLATPVLSSVMTSVGETVSTSCGVLVAVAKLALLTISVNLPAATLTVTGAVELAVGVTLSV